MKKSMQKNGHIDRRVAALCLTACILTVAIVRAVLPEGRSIDIHLDDSGVSLTLPGVQDATYDIQVKASMTEPWEPLGTVRGQDGVTVFPVTLDDSPSAFFRVLFPQPTLVASEPALLATSGGTTVYVTGQFFYAGDQIFVDGVLLEDVTFLNSSLLSGTLPTLTPGLHKIEVVSGHSGLVLATLNNALEVSPSLARTLQAPPEWLPAAPARSLTLVSAHACTAGQPAGAGQQTRLSDPPSGLATGKRLHKPMTITVDGEGSAGSIAASDHDAKTGNAAGRRDHASGLPTGRRMHKPMAPNGAGSPNLSSNRLGDDSDDDGIMDVSLHSGEVQQQVVDLAVPGRGLDFLWVRTYRSRTGIATAQGNRWSHSYDVRCVQSSTGIDLYDGTGRKDTFRLQADGTYTCPEFFREGALDTDTGAFRLTFADTGYWEFNPFDALSPAGGKLAQIVDRHGNTMTLNYDGSGRLTTIIDDLDRTYTVAYAPGGQIASVSDFSGRTVTYAYYSAGDPNGRAGDLKSVTSPAVTNTSTGNDFPSGKTTIYTYSTNAAPETSSLLLSTIDALDQNTVHCVYDLDPVSPTFARCVSVQRGTDASTCITYLSQSPAPGNRFAALRCIVNDPEGNVSEHDFDSRNRPVALREYTGRATPGQPVTTTANRPAGKLRETDPDLFESTWSWNNDSLCTRWQRPLTNRVEWVYQADLDSAAPPRQRGNLRTARCIANGGLDDDIDGDGLSDSFVYSFEHDPRFGSDPSLSACNSVDDDCHGNPDDMKGFVTRVTNPRGFETRCEYDAAGNLVTLTRHGIVLDTTPPTMSRVDFEHNAYGQLTACVRAEDGAGNRRRDEYTYYASGASAGYLQTCVVDADDSGRNLTTSYEYDARGNVTRCVDPKGTPTEFEVNALNHVVQQTKGATPGERSRARYFYDANNNLVQVDVENRDGEGTLNPTNAWITTQYQYDALRRLTRLMQEAGGSYGTLTNEFAYDSNDRLVLARSPLAVEGSDPSHVTHYAYDERGLLFRMIGAGSSPAQSTTQCDYDANGNLRAARGGCDTVSDERVTQYRYDGLDRCVSVTDPMGNETRYEYDANGNRTRAAFYGETTDALGSVDNLLLSQTLFEYDELDRCIHARKDWWIDIYTRGIADGGQDTSFAYAPVGHIVAITNDLGRATTFTFDTAMFLTGVVDAKSNRTEYAYDFNGNVLSTTQTDRSDLGGPDEVIVRNSAYDALNRCVADWDNVGNTNSYAYDSRGNRVRHTDARGFYHESDFDGLSRLTSNRKGMGGSAQSSTHYTYDAASRLAASTDSNTNTTQYVYDSLDRLVRTTLADGTSVTNLYDVHGNLVWSRDANGTEIVRVYDALERCIQRDITPGAGVASNTTLETYQYDGMSRLVRAANNHTEIVRDYDSLGRCVREGTASPTLGFSQREYTRVFDAHGLLLEQTNSSGRVIGYSYDELDREAGLSKADAGKALNFLAAFAYAGPDRLVRVTRTNGVQSDYTYIDLNGVAKGSYEFGLSRRLYISHSLTGAAPIDERLFAYDRNQNKTLRSLTSPFVAGGPTNRQEFVYDSLDRLVHAVASTNGATLRDTAYTLDPMGNRLSVIRDSVDQLYWLDPTLPAPADFQVHQYTTTPFDARQYDENGNLHQSAFGDAASPETCIFSYDYANRLVAVQGSSGPLATYAYDALGRRIAKVVFGATTDAPALTNRYLYADGQLIEEESGDGAVQTFVVPQGGGSGGRVTITASGDLLFHHCDDQGSLLAITDEAGQVVERFDYDEYGAPVFLDAAGNPRSDATAPLTDVRQLFSGMIWNAELGLYGGGDNNPSPYMNKGELIDAIAKDARLSACPYFDPKTGRTLTRNDDGGDAPYLPGLNKAELIDAMAKVAGWGDAPYLPGMNKGELIDAIAKEASFSSSRSAARTGRNPQTGKEIKIAAKKVAKFKAGKALADTVKGISGGGGAGKVRYLDPPSSEIKADLKKLADELVNLHQSQQSH